MTLAQIKKLIIGILKGWFINKKVLDKISEDDSGISLRLFKISDIAIIISSSV